MGHNTLKNKRVLILVNNTFTNDTRVLKEGRTLHNAGYDVTLVCFNDGTLPDHEVIEGIKVNRIFFKRTRNVRKSFWSKCLAAF